MRSTDKGFSGAAAVTSQKDSLILSDASSGFRRERPVPGARDLQPPIHPSVASRTRKKSKRTRRTTSEGTATITPTMHPGRRRLLRRGKPGWRRVERRALPGPRRRRGRRRMTPCSRTLPADPRSTAPSSGGAISGKRKGTSAGRGFRRRSSRSRQVERLKTHPSRGGAARAAICRARSTPAPSSSVSTRASQRSKERVRKLVR